MLKSSIKNLLRDYRYKEVVPVKVTQNEEPISSCARECYLTQFCFCTKILNKCLIS